MIVAQWLMSWPSNEAPAGSNPDIFIFFFISSDISQLFFCLIAVFFLFHIYVFHYLENFPTFKLYILEKKSLIQILVLVEFAVLIADPCLCIK